MKRIYVRCSIGDICSRHSGTDPKTILQLCQMTSGILPNMVKPIDWMPAVCLTTTAATEGSDSWQPRAKEGEG